MTPSHLLKKWIDDRTNVMIYLVNGVKLNGCVIDYSVDKLVLERNGQMQIIWEQAISTMSPAVAHEVKVIEGKTYLAR